MKLQFKQQDFQLQAIEAVVKCFEGQALKSGNFTLERSKQILKKASNLAKGIMTFEALENELNQDIGYRNSGIRIADEQLLKNIVAVQRENYLIENKQLDTISRINIGYNLTIEMETGTGKTYTYIRTMYELHKHYGWSKFIIVVPSIAIREGVHKSFELTQSHFQEIYGHKIAAFIYNSARPQDIESFAADSRISVMIINTQAFAATGKDARRIYQKLDQFGSRKPIDIIAQTNPIIIMDEPQSVGKKDSKTLESMQAFQPLATLRYSATHIEEYNKIFRLDALDAYSKKLVKKIQVKGINLKGSTGTDGYLYLENISYSPNKPPLAILEYEKRTGNGVKRVREKLAQGADLFQLSGELPAYQNHTITEINGFQNKIVIGKEELYPGDVLNDHDENLFRRIQIRETILSHLKKEKVLFEKGIKVLSLFFIDSVEKYRVYNELGEEELGEYAQIFEEEYKLAINDFMDLFSQDYNDYVLETDAQKVHKVYAPGSYLGYLQRDDADRVHNGYFSIDKKGRPVDPTVKRGSEDSEDESAYDLIMKDKERLLSFEEPTRFIFSHSALKEGWDNPNVFQICALKNVDGGSQTRRRQEVGRGMRLCVDKNGIRQDFELIGEQVHEINKLTVIASESYENFAKGLQKEIADSLKDRPVKADSSYFFGKLLTNERGEEHRLTQEDSNKLNKFLYKNDILDEDDKITSEGKEKIEKGEVPVPENLQEYALSINNLLKAVYNGEAPKPEDERKQAENKLNNNFAKKEFQELWNRISMKTVYEVKFDTERLIDDSRIRLDADLHISAKSYEIKTGELTSSDKQTLQEGKGIYTTETEQQKIRAEIYSETAYDLVGEIEFKTNLKRSTISAILSKISPKTFALIRQNPEEFIAKSAKLINETKASLIINNIAYHKTEEHFDAKTVFTNEQNVLQTDEVLKKHIYDFLKTDSGIEKDFAKNLEEAVEVIVYAKLPRNFYVSTPIANYNPDWAIVLDKEKVKHIYFIAETKGSDDVNDLRSVEQLKIHCAKEHFKTISGGEVRFDVITNYRKLLDVVELK
ncbi:MAG: hypothetical protein RJA25_1458 [Bacteroidota bacterium]